MALIVVGALFWYLWSEGWLDGSRYLAKNFVFTNQETQESITVSFDTERDTATMKSEEYGTVKFNQTISASGARYEDPDTGMILWNKGNEITLYQGDTVLFTGSTAVESNSTVTGSVSYLERVALPAGAVVDVDLLDSASKVVASARITTAGEQVPIPFVIEYDPNKINENERYSLSARISVGNQPWWVSTDFVPALTYGAGKFGINIIVRPASAQVAPSSGASVSLANTEYKMVSFNGKEVPDDAAYTVSFTADERINAKFCNDMSGKYTFVNGVISGTMMQTLKLCIMPEGVMDAETVFGSMIGTGANLSVEGNNLTLSDNSNVLVFVKTN